MCTRKMRQESKKKVFHYDEAGSFGELALMYNAPRAASVRALTQGILWAVDRVTFRHIIIESTVKKRATYESFLEKVPLLVNFSKSERSQMADSLEGMTFQDKEIIIRQGEKGDKFFIVFQGEVIVTDHKEVELNRLKTGDYFGERALILNQPRAANVISVGTTKTVVMDHYAFERLLVDLKDVMQQRIASYRKT